MLNADDFMNSEQYSKSRMINQNAVYFIDLVCHWPGVKQGSNEEKQ
jgi:hypothetical protein